METDKTKRHAWLSRAFIGILILLCATLGVLQYQLTGQLSVAERERLHSGLQTSLRRLSQEFNGELTTAAVALVPPAESAETNLKAEEVEKRYAKRYIEWRESSQHARLFRGVLIAFPQEDAIVLRRMNMESAAFQTVEWPEDWSATRARLERRLTDELAGPRGFFAARDSPNATANNAGLLVLPHFRRMDGPGARGDLEWLLLETDLNYVRSFLAPELIQRHLAGAGKLVYQVEISARGNPPLMVYPGDSDGGSKIGNLADASVGLFDLQPELLFRRAVGDRRADEMRGKGPPKGLRKGFGEGPGPGPGGPQDRGRWQMLVRHQAGSLEAVVQRARVVNLVVIFAILLLMLAMAGALLRFTDRARKLAELQMQFVAGVSHELRTPLSVIRTAAHNLRSGVVTGGKQIERYGVLIVEEAERLTNIVEQVLRFASTKAGSPLGGREQTSVVSLIDSAIQATAASVAESGCHVEKHVGENLPPILADPVALKHALQNLLSNAAKYGAEGGWIGVTAASSADESGVEIRVVDRGAGIPADELGQIFDPFYRGKRAIEDQIHGTGLGLNLVKRIVEAHQGTVTVTSSPAQGTEFLVRIPALPVEQRDEFADSISRG